MDIINNILNTHEEIQLKDKDKLNTIHNTIESDRLSQISQISVNNTKPETTLKFPNKG